MSIADFPTQGTIGASLKPKRYDIEIYHGDTFAFFMLFKDEAQVPVNLTGWTGLMQIKDAPGGAVKSTATVTISNPTEGRARISIDSSTLDPASYVYDLQFTNGSEKRTYIGGKINVTEDISE